MLHNIKKLVMLNLQVFRKEKCINNINKADNNQKQSYTGGSSTASLKRLGYRLYKPNKFSDSWHKIS